MGLFSAKISAEEKGDKVGYAASVLATLAARELVKQLPQLQGGPYLEGTLDLLLETHAFYMHLSNRLAFRELGAEACDRFSRRMMVAVANAVTTTLNHDLSSAQVVAALRDKYNDREDYYSQFRQFMPERDKPPDNTLLWEFSKAIFHEFIGTGQMPDLILVDRVLMQGIAQFMKKATEILKS